MDWNYDKLSILAKRGKARSVRYLRAAVSPEEFDAAIERCIERRIITQSEVTEILKGMHMSERIERAIALVGEHGEITSGQLHAMLGLDEDEQPSEVLAEALEYGRLVKDGKYWMLPRDQQADKLAGWYMPNAQQIAGFPTVPEIPKADTRSPEEKAVEYLRSLADGVCSNAQMIEVTGLKSNTVSCSLASAVGRQVLLREGKGWKLGPNRRTNVEHAMAYLADHPERRASNAEMCAAMGYKERVGIAALLAALRSGVASGRLIRDGASWMLGAAA